MKSDRGVYNARQKKEEPIMTAAQMFYQENEDNKHRIRELEDENTRLKTRLTSATNTGQRMMNLIHKLNDEVQNLQ